MLLQALMPMEGDPAEREEDEQVGMAWTNWSEHMILKMAAAKVMCTHHSLHALLLASVSLWLQRHGYGQGY